MGISSEGNVVNKTSSTQSQKIAGLSTKSSKSVESAANNCEKALLGIPKAGYAAGKLICNIFTLNAPGMWTSTGQVFEGVTDVPMGVLGAGRDLVSAYFGLVPDEVKDQKAPLEKAIEEDFKK